MHDNPAQDWQWLAENYRAMLDEELEELAASFGDLTETAQQVLRTELKNRGLAEPGAKPVAPKWPQSSATGRWAGSVDADADVGQADEADQSEDGSPREYTWKTPLCECETSDQARQLYAVLKRAGIDSWVENASSRWGGHPRVVVAADQLERAIEIANQPIPTEIVEESRIEMPEYVAPKCPGCGDEDPVLESAEPTNSWLCEACGREWTEPAIGADSEAEKAGK